MVLRLALALVRFYSSQSITTYCPFCSTVPLLPSWGHCWGWQRAPSTLYEPWLPRLWCPLCPLPSAAGSSCSWPGSSLQPPERSALTTLSTGTCCRCGHCWAPPRVPGGECCHAVSPAGVTVPSAAFWPQKTPSRRLPRGEAVSPCRLSAEALHAVTLQLETRGWLLTPAQRCPLVRAAFLQVLTLLPTSFSPGFAQYIHDTISTELGSLLQGGTSGCAELQVLLPARKIMAMPDCQ